MSLPDAAALDRIHAILLARRANTDVSDAETVAAIETVLEATGREYVDDAPGPEPVPFRRAPHLRLVGAMAEDRTRLTDDKPDA